MLGISKSKYVHLRLWFGWRWDGYEMGMAVKTISKAKDIKIKYLPFVHLRLWFVSRFRGMYGSKKTLKTTSKSKWAWEKPLKKYLRHTYIFVCGLVGACEVGMEASQSYHRPHGEKTHDGLQNSTARSRTITPNTHHHCCWLNWCMRQKSIVATVYQTHKLLVLKIYLVYQSSKRQTSTLCSLGFKKFH